MSLRMLHLGASLPGRRTPEKFDSKLNNDLRVGVLGKDVVLAAGSFATAIVHFRPQRWIRQHSAGVRRGGRWYLDPSPCDFLNLSHPDLPLLAKILLTNALENSR